MWKTINDILNSIDNFVWGVPLMVLILAGGILLTIRLGVMQIRKLPLALKWMVKNEEGGEGEISSFSALCTALSATIGTGNIVGVATAVGTGGPGALFWMVITAFFGMSTKFAEGLLAVKYRVVGKDGHSLGGPFYYIELGMGKKWKWLAKLFAFFGVCVGLFGIGTFSQVNGISSAVHNFFDPNDLHCVKLLPFLGEYSWSVIISSLVLSICVATVLIGGIKRIANVSQIIVPFMAIIYFAFAAILIIGNITAVPSAIAVIVKAAFSPKAVTGGVVGSIFVAMQKGIARGIFSNEAGLGSAPIAAAAAQTKEPVRQGLVQYDRNVYRHHRHLYTDRFIHRIDRCMAGTRIRRCRRYYLCFPAGTSVPTSDLCLYLNALPGIFCLYNDSWLGLLQRTLPGIFKRWQHKARENFPLDLHPRCIYRALYDRKRSMDDCRYL